MTSAKHAYRAVVLAALPGTQRQIREKTSLGVGTVSRWVMSLRGSDECHVGGWEVPANGGPITAIVHAGPGKDVPCRIKIPTEAERRRAMRKSGQWEDVKAARRVRYRILRGPRRDPLTIAFFGRRDATLAP